MGHAALLCYSEVTAVFNYVFLHRHTTNKISVF